MAQTPREIVRRALTFTHPERMPVQIWTLPWARKHLAECVAEIDRRYPSDISGPANPYALSSRVKGDSYAVGQYIDEWGCVFDNLHEGIIGEVKEPLLPDLDLWKSVKPPYEVLPADPVAARVKANAECAASHKFMLASCCPRPWERYQFIRGTEDAMMDMMELDDRVRGLLRTIHDYHLRELEFWVKTDVDGIMFMDDWGSQKQLLIPPAIWREVFKPLYKDYCDLAHSHGKFVFMHSDGHISEVYEDLIEIGVNALNSQLFCMDIEELGRRHKGRIAFWGEIDRQHVMNSLNPQDGRDAVRRVARSIYDPAGGIFIQFELSPGSNPGTVMAILDEWEIVQREGKPASIG